MEQTTGGQRVRWNRGAPPGVANRRELRKISTHEYLDAKVREAAQGCQENDLKALICTGAPTGSLLAFNLLCSMTDMNERRILSAGATNAYLQAKGAARLRISGGRVGDTVRFCGSFFGGGVRGVVMTPPTSQRRNRLRGHS